MNYWKVILATMVIFGTGVLTGGLLVRNSLRARNMVFPYQPAQVRPLPGPTGNRLEFLRRAEAQLNLSPDQRQRVERIMVESQERTKTLMEPVSPRLREEMQRTKDEFREILNPRQRRIFDELMQKYPSTRDRRDTPRDFRDTRPAPTPREPVNRTPGTGL